MLFTAKPEVITAYERVVFWDFSLDYCQKKVDRCEHKEEKDNEEEAGNDVEEEVLM